MERERVISKHEAVVQPFLKDAFKEGVHRVKPKHTLKNEWFRQIMIGVVYNDIGSTATVEELAEKHGAFKQSIALSNKSFLRGLWNNGSPKLQERYPLNEILTARKPLSRPSREKFSLVRGGTSLKIKAQVESGVTDRDKISENTGIPKSVIASLANATLKNWGIDVPRKTASHKEALKQLEEETDDKKIQELLDTIPFYMVRYYKKRRKEAPRFFSLSKLIREVGFHVRDNYTHFFASSLRNGGVPISTKERVVKGARPKTLTYYVLLSRHKDRAIQVLKEDQGLQRFQRKSS